MRCGWVVGRSGTEVATRRRTLCLQMAEPCTNELPVLIHLFPKLSTSDSSVRLSVHRLYVAPAGTSTGGDASVWHDEKVPSAAEAPCCVSASNASETCASP